MMQSQTTPKSHVAALFTKEDEDRDSLDSLFWLNYEISKLFERDSPVKLLIIPVEVQVVISEDKDSVEIAVMTFWTQNIKKL